MFRFVDGEGMKGFPTCLSSEVDPLPMSSATLTGAKAGCSFNTWRGKKNMEKKKSGIATVFPQTLTCMWSFTRLSHLKRDLSSDPRP